MAAFDSALNAFRQSQISFDELLAAARAAGGQSAAEVAAALQHLEAAYRGGGLAAERYFALQAALQDQTRLAVAPVSPLSAGGDDETLLAPRPASADEATEVVPGPSAAPIAAEPTSLQTQAPTMTTESLLQGLDPSQPQAELTVGCTLKNRFVLEELLGVGGMGMVFKATDLRKVEAADKDPFVALKVLNQDFQFNPMALVGLQRETKRAQTLSHPNIIKVYDFDRDGGYVFMSMEYLQGRPLSHLIRDHAETGLPFKKAWPIIHAMAEALGHAHSKNIVHSDFKPGNVFVSDDGEIRVLDFGIACAIGRGEKDGHDATVFNARDLGAMTPAYASLEQLQHSAPDPRDDIYALACIAYELLSGKHPFGRLSAEKARELNLQPKPIPKLSRRQWKGLQKGLAFKQENRSASIDEFVASIGPRSSVYYGLWASALIIVCSIGVNVYWTLTEKTAVAEPPKVVPSLTAEQLQKIKDLLELAEIHFDVGYLTAPTGSNAFWAYQEVLKIDPYNKAAIAGLNKIADTLEQQAWEFYEKSDRSEALKRVQEGLEVNPAHKGLLSLQEKLRFN
ncbi:serine/threonine-protein kinase [Methylomonas koyamae]|uniref:serine/threonine-protein kinase n=1 Tax=Methylomonas koyamae TaxID=702114 RepID=UPI001C32EC15|nr:serine/threonine-protein kinase [Methylomonas koyamae]BBL59573.1 hypothetical protein MKFW12EY_31860 [Methylomonas koyamae]